MLAEAVLRPVQLSLDDRARSCLAAVPANVQEAALKWELDHISHGIASLKGEEAVIRYALQTAISDPVKHLSQDTRNRCNTLSQACKAVIDPSH